jgi:hypothetical protein
MRTQRSSLTDSSVRTHESLYTLAAPGPVQGLHWCWCFIVKNVGRASAGLPTILDGQAVIAEN